MDRHPIRKIVAALAAALMFFSVLPATAGGGSYVFANGDAKVYLDKDLTRQYGLVDAENVMYSISSSMNAEGRSVAQVVIGVNYILRTVWVDARYVRPLSEEEAAEYAARAREGIFYSSGVRLLNVVFTEASAEAGAPAGFVAAEAVTDAPTAAPTAAPAQPSGAAETIAPPAGFYPAGGQEAAAVPAAASAAAAAADMDEIALNFHYDEHYVRQGGGTQESAAAQTAAGTAAPGQIVIPEGFVPAGTAPEMAQTAPAGTVAAEDAFSVEEPAAAEDAFSVEEEAPAAVQQTEEPAPAAQSTQEPPAAAQNTQEPPAAPVQEPSSAQGSSDRLTLLGVYSAKAVFDGSGQWEQWNEFAGAVEFVTATTFRIGYETLCDLYPVTDDPTVLPRIHLSGDNIVRVVLPPEMGIGDVQSFCAYTAANPFSILYFAGEETHVWYLPLSVPAAGTQTVLAAGPVYETDLDSAVDLIESCDVKTALESFAALEWLTKEEAARFLR